MMYFQPSVSFHHFYHNMHLKPKKFVRDPEYLLVLLAFRKFVTFDKSSIRDYQIFEMLKELEYSHIIQTFLFLNYYTEDAQKLIGTFIKICSRSYYCV